MVQSWELVSRIGAFCEMVASTNLRSLVITSWLDRFPAYPFLLIFPDLEELTLLAGGGIHRLDNLPEFFRSTPSSPVESCALRELTLYRGCFLVKSSGER